MVLTFSIIGELPNILDTPVLIGIYTRILQPGSCLNSKEEDTVIINEILVRAASDPEFRNQLIRQPSNVLAQYNISDEAKSIIENSINELTQ